MRMKKLISGILLSLVMVLMAGASSLANVEYKLWVGGTRVTDGNADNIQAASEYGTSTGKASYDAESKVLTLNNYRYEGTGKIKLYQDYIYSPIYSKIPNITIKLVGNNSLINTASLDESKEIYGVWSPDQPMTIEGPGFLYVKGGTKTNQSTYGICMHEGGEIKNATLKIDAGNSTGAWAVGMLLGGNRFSLTNADITVKGGTGYNSYGLEIRSDVEIKDNNTSLQVAGGHATGTGNNSQSTGIFVNGTGASFTVSGGTVIASGNTYGIRTTGNLTVNSAGLLVAKGNDKAIEGTIKNAMGGNGWTDKEGTTGRTNIPSSPGGQKLDYLKVQFPYQPATITRNPEANSLTYTGAAQKLVTAGMATNGTMQYTLGTNATTVPTSGYTTSIPEKTDAGTYYVWYKAVGNASAGYSDTDPVCIPVTIKANGNYSYVSGAQGTWQKESSEVMSFHIKHTGNDEKTFNKFTGIQVDGKPVDKNKYEAKPGSVIINLKPTFLETLSVGEHKLNVVFEDGNVETSFSIIGAETNAGNLPQTGDTQNSLLYVVVAVIGLAGIGFIRKKI